MGLVRNKNLAKQKAGKGLSTGKGASDARNALTQATKKKGK